ncbi:DNA primase [Pilibacter termitis]|uniref:DNA primase n=1 Tax=Pilibacter termitis TaxID=263852 RepID=A0A1T4NY10_9ENTE|nr:DNA primase [Pilibacter termitis]SJZ84154.1 DNA primase [Pilibacter termitis]
MARIPDNVIAEIKSQANIVDIVGQYVQLEKRGKNYLGLCPFHQEKTPSFNVIEDKQFFHCFGCGKGGDVFKFVEEIKNISYVEAISEVANYAHIPFEYAVANNSRTTENSEKKELIEIHEKACEVYAYVLKDLAVGEKALAYLKNRELTEETIETFRVGFSPDDRKFLSTLFLKQGRKKEVLLKTGLFLEGDDGELFDRFSGRIMFPIRNEHGEVVAFSGRKVFTAEEAKINPDIKKTKYMNSPESLIFNKSQLLFNLDLAKNTIRKQGEVFLFEGQMDVIAAYQAGIPNGVASLGTSLTDKQIQQIARVCKSVITVFDGDNAGIKATNRAIDLFEKFPRLTLQIVSLSEGLDPDEYARKYGETSLVQTLKNGRISWFEFRKRFLRIEKNLENHAEQIGYINALLQELAKVSSNLEIDAYLNEITQEFPRFSYKVLLDQLKELQGKRSSVQPPSPQEEAFVEREILPPPVEVPVQKRKTSKIELAEQQLLYRIFYQSANKRFSSYFEGFHFYHEPYETLYVLYQAYDRQVGDFNTANFLSFVRQGNLSNIATEIFSLRFEEEVEEKEILDLIAVVQSSSIQEKKMKLKEEFHQASQAGNHELAKQLFVQLVQLEKSK